MVTHLSTNLAQRKVTFYGSRIHSGKRNLMVWRPSICPVGIQVSLWLTRGQHVMWPAYISAWK